MRVRIVGVIAALLAGAAFAQATSPWTRWRYRAIRIFRLPLDLATARPRHVAITPDDIVWYTDYGRGFIGRFDPSNGAVREYASPGGPNSQPYAMAAVSYPL